MSLTCPACLTADHRRCHHGACACSICTLPRPVVLVRPRRAPSNPFKPGNQLGRRHGTLQRGRQPISRVEQDQMAADVLELLGRVAAWQHTERVAFASRTLAAAGRAYQRRATARATFARLAVRSTP